MRESKADIGIMILTLVSPVIAFFLSLKLSWNQRKWTLIFIITIFGSILQFPEHADSARYIKKVNNHYVGLSFNDFSDELLNAVTFRPDLKESADIYIHLVSYLIGGVLGLPRLFFMVIAFVYGYFYVSALSKILVYDKHTKKPFVFNALVLLLIIYCGIDSMQSVRTWTGMWILFNGVLGYFQTKKTKYLWLMLCAPLVHFAYFGMALPAYLVVFINRLSPKVFILAYILSFFVSIASGGIINQISRTELGERKVQGYYNESLDLMDQGKGVWYLRYGKRLAMNWGCNALAFTLIICGFYKKRMNYLEASLFTTGILMATVANLTTFIPAFYNRLMINSGLYILAVVVLLLVRGVLLSKNGFSLTVRKAMIWISVLIFFPKIVYTIANYLYYFSIYVFAFPFIGWWSADSNVSIREVIGWFL